MLDVETMDIRRVTRDDEAEIGAAWLDERTLIYSKGHESPDLYVVDVLEPGDGLGRPVTEGGSDIGFIQGWIPFETSPTGRCVGALFQDRGYEIDEFDAVIVCLDENDTPVLRNLGPMATWAAPPLVWTPDGRYVVVRRDHTSPSDDMRFQDWIIDLETGAESPFPVTPLEQPYPARWRPN